MAQRSGGTRLAVLCPSPVLTVTIEPGDEQGAEIHYHAGGQGVWVARMATALGAEVVLCVALAGEAGRVLGGLLRSGGVEVRSVSAHGRSGSYVHDRRSGERVSVASTEGPRLLRHETDELYGVMLTAGLDAGVAMLTGPQPPDALSADIYRRLAADLRANGATVLADLGDGALRGALRGGVDLLKISHVEAIAEGLAETSDPEQLLAAVAELHRQGARGVLLSRADEPALALVEDRLYELAGPRLEPSDPTGAGDSMFAGIGVALASGRSVIDALRLGMAAGALNVTRRGLGTGQRAEIERLLAHVRVSALDGLRESGPS
jgi:1-phosphofructokinase